MMFRSRALIILAPSTPPTVEALRLTVRALDSHLESLRSKGEELERERDRLLVQTQKRSNSSDDVIDKLEREARQLQSATARVTIEHNEVLDEIQNLKRS
eukprot:PhM_4_TR13139/c0_g1_i2/m.14445